MRRCFYDRQTGAVFYDLQRGKRETIEVAILSGGKVRVKAPYRMPETAIRRFLKEKAPWVKEQLEKIEKSRREWMEKRFQDGSVFYYLGEPLKLSIKKSEGETVWQRDGQLLIDQTAATPQKRKEQLEKWYRIRAKENIESRVKVFAAKIGESPNKVTIKAQKTRWGSCSSLGNLNFNWRLIMMPQKIIDYVVVHELCHLKEMNHSLAFWNRVEEIMPDYRNRRKWLKNNAWKVEWEQI